DAAAAHEHDGVLLQVVTLARNVDRDLHAVREANTGDLAERRVRLLGRGGVHAGADAAALRGSELLRSPLAGLEARSGQLVFWRLASLADELAGRRHVARDRSSGSRATTPAPRDGRGERSVDELAATQREPELDAVAGVSEAAAGQLLDAAHAVAQRVAMAV